MPGLETRDFVGVDIMAAGGPFFGNGSPPEGDTWTTTQLEQLAAANRELTEVRVPIKLGHSKDQPLLRNSGMVDERGAPAAGWLENLRVAPTGHPKAGKLLADLRKVPAKLAQLVESGAFRTRSVELSNYTPPVPGAKPRTIVSGLAFLGGQMPAVRTLDDVVALYEAAPHVAIPGDPPEGVRVLDYTVDEDAARVAPIQGDRMADVTLTAEQVATLATALGLKAEDAANLEPAKLLEAAAALKPADPDALKALEDKAATAERELEAAKTQLAAATAAAGTGGEELAKTIRELSANAELGVKAAEELRVMRRDSLIDKAIADRKIPPAKKADYQRDYDAAPDVVARIVESLEPVVDARSYGAGGGEAPLDDEAAKADEALYRAYGTSVGVQTVATDNGKVPA